MEKNEIINTIDVLSRSIDPLLRAEKNEIVTIVSEKIGKLVNEIK